MALDSFAFDAGLKKGPREMEPDSNGRKVDSFGAKADLSRSPSSNLPWDGGGTVDSFGAKADLNKEPHKGYDSYPTPLSKRSDKQSR